MSDEACHSHCFASLHEVFAFATGTDRNYTVVVRNVCIHAINVGVRYAWTMVTFMEHSVLNITYGAYAPSHVTSHVHLTSYVL